jgi:hypothetical protein
MAAGAALTVTSRAVEDNGSAYSIEFNGDFDTADTADTVIDDSEEAGVAALSVVPASSFYFPLHFRPRFLYSFIISSSGTHVLPYSQSAVFLLLCMEA